MRLPKKGERGFTLIELLIVVAILGVLAAVVIPNVQRFIGAGETEAQATELSTIQAAVSAMMVDNQLPTLPAGFVGDVLPATDQMATFPHPDADLVTEKGADAQFVTDAISAGDIALGEAGDGYLLYGHTLVIDVDGDGTYDGLDGDEIRIVNYVAQQRTSEFYTVDRFGTVERLP